MTAIVHLLLMLLYLSICAAGARIEEFLYEKLDRKVPPRPTNGEILGQFMLEAAKEFGPGTPYGKNPDSETCLTMFLLSHFFFIRTFKILCKPQHWIVFVHFWQKKAAKGKRLIYFVCKSKMS